MNNNSVQIRKAFLDFFKQNGATIVASDSLIPSGDSTLLFTSAGMVQFKQNFLGQSKDTFKRATSCQKCFRTSDIEQVGLTTRHLTFFEMLGNFSFGDYFKKEAIAWSWEFLTKNIGLPVEKLYISIYKDDDEAGKIWGKIVPASKIIKMGADTNFWNMGDTGPCGPCSEIYIDLGPDVGCGKPSCGVGCECDRYLEIWNLVFTQFDRQADSSLNPLPQKNIDTGMGLERITATACGKKSIFETDLFVPIMENAAEILKVKQDKSTTSKLRMIADHCRAVTFLISDGIIPSNEGRGYVLRRILRRALRQGKIFGYSKPFINVLAETVFKIMEPAYPELSSKLSNIQSIIKVEEEKFLETLESGTEILSEMIKVYKNKKEVVISGNDVFKLYDTYGFPQDLTKEIAAENGLKIDELGFKAAQAKAQKKSRAAWGGSGEKDVSFYAALYKRVGETVFEGYETLKSVGKVLALIKEGKEVSELKANEDGEIVVSNTPFYGESGGQVGDKGNVSNGNFSAKVFDVFKPVGNLFLHKVKVGQGCIKVGQEVNLEVDFSRRGDIARHHTCVHLLQKALKDVLGDHIAQAGSLVSDEYVRFDFTHFSALTKEDLLKVEHKVNDVIRANMPITIETMDIKKARNLGAVALFGEKYGELVRTVTVRPAGKDEIYSMELCGGTHINRTGDIGFFKIISEYSVGAGVRRIEAAAGRAAENYVLDEETEILKIAQALNASKTEIFDKIQKQKAEIKNLEQELALLKSRQISQDINSYIKSAKNVDGVEVLPVFIEGADIKTLRDLSDKIKGKMGSVIVLAASESEGKISFIVSITSDYVKQGFNAGNIAKAFASDIKGSGGGKADFAQGGSKSLTELEAAIKNINKYIKPQK
ncbi:MAG: alanine--tRNA ligase [Elusimicrobiota bacterium]|jgi:alanyl-tRNA synthetase|nr:alanine--tRNA ligase [Elusimicrobiota bacterium]